MNCPSRTDSATLEHPEWNQNPPFLAADLTTCEDLNGIVNARAHRRGGKDDVCLEGSSEKLDHLTHPHFFDPDSPAAGPPGRWEQDSKLNFLPFPFSTRAFSLSPSDTSKCRFPSPAQGRVWW